MRLDELYENCKTYRDKYNMAVEAEKIVELRLKKVELKKVIASVVVTVTVISGVVLGLTLNPNFLMLMIVALVIQLGAHIFYGDTEDELKRITRQLKRDQSFYASLHNMEAEAENRSSNESYTSSFSYSYDSRENKQRGTFKKCVTVADVKKVYRAKAKKHHPDVGGDEETFRTLVVQYERALTIAQSA